MTRLDFEMEVKRVLREKGIRGNRNGGDVKKKMIKFLGIKEA